MHIIAKLSAWYRGEYVPPPPGRIAPGHYEQPFLAKCLGIMGRFWMRHWKWLLGFLVVFAMFLLRLVPQLFDLIP